jgi:hypothetical protein
MGINVLVADQERTFAEALAARLEAESDIAVVGAVQVRVPVPWLPRIVCARNCPAATCGPG